MCSHTKLGQAVRRVAGFLIVLLGLAAGVLGHGAETDFLSHPASCSVALDSFSSFPDSIVEHGGGLNGCGCHFNRKTGECHCHRPRGCGCKCQPATCS